MGYKRFTQWTENGASLVLDNPQNAEEARTQLMEKFKLACNKLAELEDKIEQGTLIELPCKVADSAFPCKIGDKVWLLYKRYWNVADKKGFWVLRESKVSLHNKKRFSDDFGKFVFLTRKEAEKRLKELQK